MTATPPGHRSPIPFARQEADWWCGAAALAMVYGSFGMHLSQQAIWDGLSCDGHAGRSGVDTHRLGHDAIGRGLTAEVLQAADPWTVLLRCHDAGVRVILNHPLGPRSSRRHFSAVGAIEADAILLHDPMLDGPNLLPRAEFLDLWAWTGRVFDSTAHNLVAIARPAAVPRDCPRCGLGQPPALPCRRCRRPYPVGIPAAHGCLNPGCELALWRTIYCPDCDAPLTTLDGARFGGPFPPEVMMDNPQDIHKLAQAFQAYHDRLSEARERSRDPQLREQVDRLQAELKNSLDQFSETMNSLNDRLASDHARNRERLARSREKAEAHAKSQAEALERLAAKKAEKLARAQAKAAEKEVDPLLGAKLRDQLLDEFGTRRDVPPTPAGELGSAIDYWPGS
ncbi:cysteine peptidase family C39 domain-containing protein [Tundrisphaera sp. TA3]|uniref:cysteine peptidase family C39 domain-containing protein n=1 Tax=Tundrisphaera sp. TA3 TaxID=3435775 RepID=UPI003EBBE217